MFADHALPIPSFFLELLVSQGEEGRERVFNQLTSVLNQLSKQGSFSLF